MTDREPPPDPKEPPDPKGASGCPKCAAAFVGHGCTSETCVGFFSPPGHNHDDNCVCRTYTCANGHQSELSVRRRCAASGCAWVGKAACWCHPGEKLDAWPPIAVAAWPPIAERKDRT